MSPDAPEFAPFAQRMAAEGLPEVFIATFAHYYGQLVAGHTGHVPEADIRPVDELPDAESFPERLRAIGETALPRTALLNLNGGLGTSMGLERAKSLLEVREGHTFLDIIALQAADAGVPLVLMNSFATDADSRAALEAHPDANVDVPRTFLQHKEPKVARDGLGPVGWPANPALEWCPPGHGDIYTALATSGTLAALLAAGYKYAFVSNADNLGAVLDTAILGYIVENELPFVMEVADRTEMDKKGGHLAHRATDGRFVLRESAQCPAEDEATFQDIDRHRFFNTNNLWLDLPALDRVMRERDGFLGLPMIRNSKTVDPRDPESTPVFQLETAMGAAIEVFDGAGAVRVPRTRFAPVKTTDDLLAVRSDAYVLTDDFRVVPNPDRDLGPLVIELDKALYRFVPDLEAHFPHGVPSLAACRSLHIEGDVSFGRDVTLRGDVRLINGCGHQVTVPEGAVLEGEVRC